MSQWKLHTRSCDYVVSLVPDHLGLALDYWGERMESGTPVPAGAVKKPDHSHLMDVVALEYASAGQRHVAFSELLIDRPGSYTGARWLADVDGIVYSSSSDGDLLEVPFIDETTELRLTLHTSTSSSHDVVRRRVTLENRGSETVWLPRIFSAGWNVLASREVRIDYLAGRWGGETQRRRVVLGWGSFRIGSSQGITSASFAPTVIVTPVPDHDAPGALAEGSWGVALEWSGSWRLQVDSDPAGQRGVRVSCGIDDDTTTVTLMPGERFEAPDSVGVFSPDGPDGVTQSWHEYQRQVLARDLSAKTRPIVYNSWYATSFDVHVEHQLELANIAKSLGVETFVVDDGWFKGREADNAGLGDWVEDAKKFPRGLSELADGVVDLGMGFGLWIEPEMVNPESDLYRTHPDWVYRAGDRPLIQRRNQYVLDLGLPEVEEWIAATLRRILSTSQISYLKWDMNRTVTDGGRPGDPHGRQWSVQHTNAYYRLMRLIRDEFPHVIVEACASGGGRVDNRVLGLSDVVWVSDEVGPRERLAIQHGYLSAYPAHTMLGLVSEHPGMRDGRRTSLGYAFAVAMTGVLGVGGDLLKWDDEQRRQASSYIARYKEIRDIVHRGTVHIHGEPHDNLYSIEYCAAGNDGRIAIFVFDSTRDRSESHTATEVRIYPTELESGRRYMVAGTGEIVDRGLARRSGIEVPFDMADDADIIVLTPVE